MISLRVLSIHPPTMSFPSQYILHTTTTTTVNCVYSTSNQYTHIQTINVQITEKIYRLLRYVHKHIYFRTFETQEK